MNGLHYVLHAPQGDTYADLLFTMIERRGERPPVTYTTFQARDLGGDTAELFKTAVRDAYETLPAAGDDRRRVLHGRADPGRSRRPRPRARSADPGHSAGTARLSEEGELGRVRRRSIGSCAPRRPAPRARVPGARPRCNILGPTALGFRHRDDVSEISGSSSGSAWTSASPRRSARRPRTSTRLGEADFNVVLYPEIALPAAQWLEKNHKQPFTQTVPIGVGATREFIAEVAALAGVDPAAALDDEIVALALVLALGRLDLSHRQAGLHLRRRDPRDRRRAGRARRTRLRGRRARNLRREIRARRARARQKLHGVEALITDDYLEVEAKVAELQPELVLGTQMERHIAKRLRIPCAVISAPIHVQDFPARYSPQMGFEGANVIFDTWVHPLMMGLEEHLLAMFREDPEFHEAQRRRISAAPRRADRAPTPRARRSGRVSDQITSARH